MARPKKVKLDTAKQVHGAIEVQKPEDSLYSLMGKNMFPYVEKTAESYRSKLEEMNLADLQRHAIEIANIIPNTMNRNLLIDKLEKEYLRKQFQFVDKKNVNPIPTESNLDTKQEKDLQKWLSRGR